MVRTALVLVDGTWFGGYGFGAPARGLDAIEPVDPATLRELGEVVFNTAMVGYPEVLTDPSYTGQIVTMTYPHAGNYGIDPHWSERGPASQGDEVAVAGFVVRRLYTGPVPRGRIGLSEYLAAHGVPGIAEVDTRALTLHLRDAGSQNGLLFRPADGVAPAASELERARRMLTAFPAMEGRNLLGAVGSVTAVARPSTERANPTNPTTVSCHVALWDTGTKANIVRILEEEGCSVTLLPSNADATAIRATGADALFISNGPGDPATLRHQVDVTRALIDEMPVLGICLGHQIVCEALGAKTYKMKFGHHGVNHPVRDEFTKRVFVTSQNHGFAVDPDSLPRSTRVWFQNANDRTIEGIWDDARAVCTTQFHPEAAPGPLDARYIFARMLSRVARDAAAQEGVDAGA